MVELIKNTQAVFESLDEIINGELENLNSQEKQDFEELVRFLGKKQKVLWNVFNSMKSNGDIGILRNVLKENGNIKD